MHSLRRPMSKFAIAVHGGAGDIDPARKVSPYKEQYEAGLRDALLAGEAVLKDGGLAIDAVHAAVISLENCPMFNAGHGACMCRDGEAELDASIMDGRNHKAGAVASLHHIKNPISAAYHLLDHQHVLMVGSHADELAKAAGLEWVERDYFKTPDRIQQWQVIKDSNEVVLDHESSGGTVGAVARDEHGNLAAATSTGGMTNQLPGRVGDTAIIGAGTWAENELCAVSATGTGEMFIRTAFAKTIADELRHGAAHIRNAGKIALDHVDQLGGWGGCILMPVAGDPVLIMNSKDMLCGSLDSDGNIYTATVGEELNG